MKSNEYWKTMETELQVLKSKRGEMNKDNSTTEQRKALSKQIHLLSVKINQHNKVIKYRAENPIDRSNTLVHRMFGKSERSLLPDEYREYNRVQHRLRRRELKRINCNQKKEATVKKNSSNGGRYNERKENSDNAQCRNSEQNERSVSSLGIKEYSFQS